MLCCRSVIVSKSVVGFFVVLLLLAINLVGLKMQIVFL